MISKRFVSLFVALTLLVFAASFALALFHTVAKNESAALTEPSSRPPESSLRENGDDPRAERTDASPPPHVTTDGGGTFAESTKIGDGTPDTEGSVSITPSGTSDSSSANAPPSADYALRFAPEESKLCVTDASGTVLFEKVVPTSKLDTASAAILETGLPFASYEGALAALYDVIS